MNKKNLLLALGLLASTGMNAQLSSNPDKFLGNITTSWQVDYGSEKFYTLWNQITCENESKWQQVEGTNNSFNWGCDNAVKYAKNHNFPFKFHALIWGSQYPTWLEKQTPEQRYKEIIQWMDAVKKKYPNLQLIDVVNEAVSGHQAGTKYFIEALGGTGVTGYDWLIKAFELAYERWPDAILIYNDFNTFQWNTDQYIDLVKTLRDAGAPIDAYGCQSHDLTDLNVSSFKSVMTKLQNSLKMPMYSTEYDIGTDDDDLQLQRYKEQIPYMWEADYCAGVTLWGYIYGKTWTTDGNSGIIRNGKDRPAMTWLREYMKTDAAKNAKSPFPGMVKEASVYIKPSSLNIEKGKENTITVHARMKTKTIEKVELYAGSTLIATMTEGVNNEYVATYTPTATGTKELKAVVTTTDGESWTRYSSVNICNPRAPYKNTIVELPGKVQFENFDTGADGIAFHDANSSKQGDASSYRTDTGGIDIGKGGSGYCVGYTEAGEWMEYTVNVKEAGLYSYDIYYSAPENGATVNIAVSSAEGVKSVTEDKVVLAKTGGWSTYKTGHGRMLIPLEEGEQRIRFTIVGGASQYIINLDYITFTRTDINEDINLAISSDAQPTNVGTKTTISANVESSSEIKNVKFYTDGLLSKTLTAAPYEFTVTPTVKGEIAYTAIATDVDGKESKIASYTLTVNPKRTPYKGVITIPGVIEAENFDKGGEGFTFHDDDTDDAKSGYRSDNEGVDIKKLSIGGYGLGWTAVGDWYEYSINVIEDGKYNISAICSSGQTGSGFSVSLADDGKLTTLWTINVSKTGDNSWDTYKTFSSTVKKYLSEGNHILRITITGANCDIDKLELKCVEPTAITDVNSDAKNDGKIYNLAGQVVDENYKGIVIKNGKKILKR